MANQEGAAFGLVLSPEMLRPIIEAVTREVFLQMESAREATAGQIALSEEQAAQLIGVRPHVLRDERLRGKIKASQIVGRRTRYLRSDLLNYLAGRRAPSAAA